MKFVRRSVFNPLLIALLTILFSLILSAVIYIKSTTSFDLQISRWVTSQSTPVGLVVFHLITNLGSYSVVHISMALLCIWLIYRRDWIHAIMVIALVLLAPLIDTQLKQLIARPRPMLPQDNLYLKDYSFPSGHTLLGTVFYTMTAYLGWIYAGKPWLKWTIVIVSFGLLIFIGFSRVYLGVHFLTDVVGAWLIGSLMFLSTGLLINWLYYSVERYQNLKKR